MTDPYAYLEEAVEMNGWITMDMVKELVEKGYMQLWARTNAVAATAEEERLGQKILTIVLAGGNLEQLKDIECEIEQYAIANGFGEIYINGRKGWERALQGYKTQMVIMRKVLKNEFC
jgi:hypothetical protein